MTSPAKRRQAVTSLQERFPVSERRACRVIGLPRSTRRYQPKVVDREAPLTKQIVELATQYGRYGCRRITALLRTEGWRVNHKRVERIWRQEGLKVLQKQPNAAGYGSTMVRVCGCVQSTRAMSGAMISCWRVPTTDDHFAF